MKRYKMVVNINQFLVADKKRGTALLKLNKAIYNLEAINETILVFQEVSEIKCKSGDFYYLTFKAGVSGECPDEIAFDFCNYIIALMKNKAMV
jgi:hypothetical protein